MSAQDVAPQGSHLDAVMDRTLTAWGTRMDRLAYACTVLVVLECTLGSSGRWLVVGGLSGRNLLLLALLLLSAPRVWVQRRELLHSWVLRLTILALATLAVGTIIGFNNGNRPAFIEADVTTFVALLLVPGVLATVDNRGRLEGLIKALVGGATLLATATLVVFVLSSSSVPFALAVNSYLNEHQFGGLARLTPEVLRIYMRSGIFFPLALPYVLVAFSRGRHRFWSLVSMAALLMGILFSFTRGFVIAAVLGVVMMLVASRWTGARLRPLALLLLGVIIAFAASFLVPGQSTIGDAWMARVDPESSTLQASTAPAPTSTLSSPIPNPSPETPTATPSKSRAPAPTPIRSNPVPNSSPETPDATPSKAPDDEQNSAKLRELTLQREWQAFTQRPVLGWGLGYNLDGLRDDGRTEYMYLDYLAKLGVVGTLGLFAIFVVPAAIAVLRLLRTPRTRLDARTQIASLSLISLLAMALASYSNPFLSNTLGICVLLLSLAAARQAGLHPHPVRPAPASVHQGSATPPERRGDDDDQGDRSTT